MFAGQQAQITRRNFVAAAGAAVGVAAGAAAASSLKVAMANEVAEVSDIEWDDEADLVVIGGGGAGCSSAWWALDGGASAIVLESSAACGGASRYCSGMMILAGTKLQEELGFGGEDLSKFKAFMLRDGENIGLKDELVDVYVNNGGALYDWVSDTLGAEFPKKYGGERNYFRDCFEALAAGDIDYQQFKDWGKSVGLYINDDAMHPTNAEIGDLYPHCHIPVFDKAWEWHGHQGAAIMDPMVDQIEEKGGKIYLNTKGVGLVMDGDGTVIGVKAEDEDGAIRYYKADRGVMLAAGTYCENREMVEQYNPIESILDTVSLETPGCDGTTLKMAMKAGAALANMSSTFAYAVTQFGIYTDFRPIIRCAVVNREGSRFVAEDKYYSQVTIRMMEQQSANEDGAAWYIVDNALYNDLQHLYDVEMDASANNSDYPVATPIASDDELVVADTIEELAEKLNMPYLPTTIQMYNEDVDSGTDRVCGKDMRYMTKIEEPPFRAGKNLQLGLYGHGGLDINAQGQVLSTEGEVIPGLYAGGRNARSLIEGRYDQGSGISLPTGLIMGMVVGKQIAAQASQK